MGRNNDILYELYTEQVVGDNSDSEGHIHNGGTIIFYFKKGTFKPELFAAKKPHSQCGVLHRLDGPAVCNINRADPNSGLYYVDGKSIPRSVAEFEDRLAFQNRFQSAVELYKAKLRANIDTNI